MTIPLRPDPPPPLLTGRGRAFHDTPLPPWMADEFRAWLARNDVQDLDNPAAQYDYRGAFLANVGRGGDQHFTDQFKKPQHPTFSVESQYATGPYQAIAGSWNGDQYVPAKAVMLRALADALNVATREP